MGSDPIVHEEPEAEVVSDESDSVETDIENTASEVEGEKRIYQYGTTGTTAFFRNSAISGSFFITFTTSHTT